MTSTTFNPIEHMNGAIKVGFTREQAEYQAEQIAKIVNEQVVSKSYLATQLKELEMKLIVKVGAMMFVQTGLIVTIIGLLLHK